MSRANPAGICAVIIPYFQRNEDIFLRALESVFAQSFQNFFVLVIDDESPLPAEAVLARLDVANRQRVRMIRQQNQGPGGARNTGLDAVPEGVEFVAFLDSDDVWEVDHLERSVARLTTLGADASWSLIAAGPEFDPYLPIDTVEERDLIRPAPGHDTTYFVDDLSRFVLHKWWHFLHLSTLVITRRVFSQVRFRLYFRLAGEDLMFFYDCAKHARSLIVSTEVGAMRGLGQNFYSGTEFASPKAVRQMFYSIRAIQTIGRENRFRGMDAVRLADWKRETREHALRNMVSGLVRRRWHMIGLILQWIGHDPQLLPASVRMGGRIASKRWAAPPSAEISDTRRWPPP